MVPALCAALAAALAVAAYQNTFHNPFVFDDKTEIVENASIREMTDWGRILGFSQTRPVVNFSYALDYATSELNPFGYHLTNVLLHALNVLLLFVLARRLARQVHSPDLTGPAEPVATLTAFTAASLFAVHPVMTEAVGYVSSRAELLCASLFLASLLAFMRGFDGPRGPWFAAGAVLFALALGAKETAAMLPFVLLAYDAFRLKGTAGTIQRSPLQWKVHVPLIAVVSLVGAVRIWFYMRVEHPIAAGIQWEHALVELDVMAKYLTLLVIPVSLSIVHAVYPITTLLDVRVLLAIGILGTAVAAGVFSYRRQPLVTFGLVWFVLVQIPAASLMLLADRGQPMAEHRIYLASCGFFLAVGALVAHLSLSGRAISGVKVARAGVGLALVLAVLFGLTVARNRVWADPVLLWEDAARKAPRTFMAHYGVADSYAAIGDCESAAPAYSRALVLRPDRKAFVGLSSCLVQLDRRDDARRVLRTAIERVPLDADVRLALAELELERQNFAEALRLCREVLGITPGQTEAGRCVESSERALSGR